MRYRVTTPVAGFTGISAGINFTNGVAEFDVPEGQPGDELRYNARSLAYFRAQGYGVEELDERAPAAADPGPQEPPAPFDPAEHGVDEVLAYLADADEGEQARVLAAEADGKNRKTITEKGAAS